MTDQATRARHFLRLHHGDTPLLLPNPWDAGSAKLFASLGFHALATTSSGHAATLGRLDGGVTRDEALAHAASIVAATELPVSADLENGFAHQPADVAETARLAAEVGLAGFSIEDYTGDDDDPIYDPTTAAARVAAAAAAAQAGRRMAVHRESDTGMARVGTSPDEAPMLGAAITGKASLALGGVWTHCPVADELDNPFTVDQVKRFNAVVDQLRSDGHQPELVHMANSAATIAHPDTHFDMVRCGIALYGIAPAPALADLIDLQPAMTLHSEVSFVKRIRPGTPVSYGHAWAAPIDTIVATVPIGYADGIRRRYATVGGEALIGGRRHRVVGQVTMDQLLIDCGDHEVAAGDPVVFIGAQDGDEISAAEVADRLGTIAYEVVCDIGTRVRRRYR